ncbi:MAG: hypothetical protein HYY51_03485 [Candidatus Magasanikbacteria bacterium]|nr:hypothetical protein [Candidatus Magasanikbacteria bacterium]
MRKTWKVLGICSVLLLLAGAGCVKGGSNANNGEENKAASKSAETKTDPLTTTINTEAATGGTSSANGDIRITKAEAVGNGTLEIELLTAKSYDDDADGYRLLLSSEANPEWPTKGYWYELGPTYKEKTWTGLPLGKKYLRACVVIDKECAAYSEQMEVEIK